MNIKKDNTEEKIFQAAQKVFVRKGLDGARMQEIANEAGINKALLHYYFRTKEKLFEAIFKHVFSQIFPDIRELVVSNHTIEDKLGTFIEKYIDLLVRHPFLPAFILKEIGRDPEFMAEQIKSRGIDPGIVLKMFEKEMTAGRIRSMDPKDLLINLLSLCIFPVASKPLMTVMMFENDSKAYQNFLHQRKTTVREFILHSILIDKSGRNNLSAI